MCRYNGWEDTLCIDVNCSCLDTVVPSHFINERNDEQGRDEGEKLDSGSRGRQKKRQA